MKFFIFSSSRFIYLFLLLCSGSYSQIPFIFSFLFNIFFFPYAASAYAFVHRLFICWWKNNTLYIIPMWNKHDPQILWVLGLQNEFIEMIPADFLKYDFTCYQTTVALEKKFNSRQWEKTEIIINYFTCIEIRVENGKREAEKDGEDEDKAGWKRRRRSNWFSFQANLCLAYFSIILRHRPQFDKFRQSVCPSIYFDSLGFSLSFLYFSCFLCPFRF